MFSTFSIESYSAAKSELALKMNKYLESDLDKL